MTNIAAQEKEWQAESDARTLSEAEVIKNDEARMKAAQKAAKKMADDKMAEAEAMKNVADGKLHYPSMAGEKK